MIIGASPASSRLVGQTALCPRYLMRVSLHLGRSRDCSGVGLLAAAAGLAEKRRAQTLAAASRGASLFKAVLTSRETTGCSNDRIW